MNELDSRFEHFFAVVEKKLRYLFSVHNLIRDVMKHDIDSEILILIKNTSIRL
jgi:hypothetical protein